MTHILGIDYGDKRIGLALSDPFAWTAQPFKVLTGLKRGQIFVELEKIIREHDVATVVLGLPLHMDGREGEQAAKVRRFAAQIADRIAGIEIDFFDERLSTAGAERVLVDADLSRRRRRQVIDKQAASFMLQGYLECKRHAAS